MAHSENSPEPCSAPGNSHDYDIATNILLKVLQHPTFRNLDWLPSELRRQSTLSFSPFQLLIQISLSVTINQASILWKLSGMFQVGELWGATFPTPRAEKRCRNKSYLKFLYLTQTQFSEYTAAINLLLFPAMVVSYAFSCRGGRLPIAISIKNSHRTSSTFPLKA